MTTFGLRSSSTSGPRPSRSSVPGRKFSMTTWASSTRRRIVARPSSDLRSTTAQRFPRDDELPVERRAVGRVGHAHAPGAVARAGPFDLEHVGAVVGEVARRARARRSRWRGRGRGCRRAAPSCGHGRAAEPPASRSSGRRGRRTRTRRRCRRTCGASSRSSRGPRAWRCDGGPGARPRRTRGTRPTCPGSPSRTPPRSTAGRRWRGSAALGCGGCDRRRSRGCPGGARPPR